MRWQMVSSLPGCSSATFASGMIVPVVAFPLAAILLRGPLVAILDSSDTLQRRIGFGLEVAAALAVTALGLWPLVSR